MTAQHPAAPETETDANGLRELLAAATPGPWGYLSSTGEVECVYIDPECKSAITVETSDGASAGADAALIAGAVNALPALLADLDAARERVRVVASERDAAHPPMDNVTAALYGNCHEAYESAHMAANTLRTQRDLLASAMWDSRKEFGFDTDGASGYHTQDYGFISESFRRDMAEVRTEIVDLNAEVIAAEDRAESAEAAHEAEKAAHERLRAGVEALADEWANTPWDQTPHLGCLDMYRHCAGILATLLGGGGAR